LFVFVFSLAPSPPLQGGCDHPHTLGSAHPASARRERASLLEPRVKSDGLRY
jgi:hypothetical protein